MHFNRDKFQIFPGVAVLLPPQGLVMGYKIFPGIMRNIGMHFLPAAPEDELVWMKHVGRNVQLQHLSVIREIARYIDFVLFQVHENQEEEISRLGESLLSVFLRNLRMGPELPIDRLIRKQAEEMCARPEITVSGPEMAHKVGLSPSQFFRRFHKLYEMSPRDFLLQQRIEKARTLLKESQMTVGEIAESLGYRDVGYFSKQFKQKAGMSPLMLRKQFLERT